MTRCLSSYIYKWICWNGGALGNLCARGRAQENQRHWSSNSRNIPLSSRDYFTLKFNVNFDRVLFYSSQILPYRFLQVFINSRKIKISFSVFLFCVWYQFNFKYFNFIVRSCIEEGTAEEEFQINVHLRRSMFLFYKLLFLTF